MIPPWLVLLFWILAIGGAFSTLLYIAAHLLARYEETRE